jgi:hypothetical protein
MDHLREYNTFKKVNESHEESDNYMFFANVGNIKRMCEEILSMDKEFVDSLLSDGHGWATDHIATSKDDVEEVYQFLNSVVKGQEKKGGDADCGCGCNGMISDCEGY